MKGNGNGVRRWKRYPEYKESGAVWLHGIPAHWEERRLKYVARLAYGDSLPDGDREAGEVAVFGSNGVVGMHKHANTSAPVIVIGRKGSFGKINYSASPCFAIDTTYFIDSHTTTADVRWLFHVLPLLGLDSVSKDSAVPGLSREDAYANCLPVPPKEECRLIAAFLDCETTKIDALVAKKERLIELLQEKRAALISHAVTKGLDPNVPMKDSGVEWLGKIPKHWDVMRMKHVCKLQTGHTPRKSEERFWVSGECTIPWISLNDTKILEAGDFIDDTTVKISPIGVKNSAAHLIEKGAVVFNRDGARVGLAAITTKPMCLSQHLIGWVCGASIHNYYLLHVIYAMEQEIYHLTAGATIPTIGMPDIKRMVMPVPPLEEQKVIAGYLVRKREQLTHLIRRIGENITLLREYRTALISAAVTGKIDVREEV
jgi:type I restriction enzyme S subunit